MKKTILTGEFAEEIIKQNNQIAGLRTAIDNMAQSAYYTEKEMWKHIKKEFPNISSNTTLNVADGVATLIDRLAN